MLKFLIIPLVFLATACTASQQQLAEAVVPAVVNTAAMVIPGLPVVLSDAAKVACAGQAVANESGDSKLSQILGVACTW